MRARPWVIVAIVDIVALTACVSVRRPAPEAGHRWIIHAVVVDPAGQPVEWAEVALFAVQPREVIAEIDLTGKEGGPGADTNKRVYIATPSFTAETRGAFVRFRFPGPNRLGNTQNFEYPSWHYLLRGPGESTRYDRLTLIRHEHAPPPSEGLPVPIVITYHEPAGGRVEIDQTQLVREGTLPDGQPITRGFRCRRFDATGRQIDAAVSPALAKTMGLPSLDAMWQAILDERSRLDAQIREATTAGS